ncbi:MAG TPA: THUMP domain-containing protein, partial [Kofleriaceae bacterium]|nr:THUMP domain-containing protein [Kofleriaceae bacterium]
MSTAREMAMLHWNVIVTVRRDFGRAIRLLRKLGATERTGLFNVLLMRVPDVRALLEQIAQVPADEHFFETISHVVPVTHKLSFSTADDFERGARDIVLGWLPQLAGKSVHVRMRRRGHKGELHALDIERRLGGALIEELARRGTPGHVVLDDPDAVIAIETIRDEAGLALWTRSDLERYPFLRASIERGASRRAAPVPTGSAPSRAILAAAGEIAARSRTPHPASASEIVDLLGELEPLTLEKLLATGATIGEVAEAVSAIEDEDAFGEIHHAPSTPREAEVRAILEDLLFEDFEERESE